MTGRSIVENPELPLVVTRELRNLLVLSELWCLDHSRLRPVVSVE